MAMMKGRLLDFGGGGVVVVMRIVDVPDGGWKRRARQDFDCRLEPPP
jgi:hypothetical protein